jgi:hypothetical protein
MTGIVHTHFPSSLPTPRARTHVAARPSAFRTASIAILRSMHSPPAAHLIDSHPSSFVAPSAPAADAGVERELRWFRAAWSVCWLAALLMSHNAWLSSGRDYPPVPAFDWVPQPPFPLDWVLFAAMAAALLGMSFARRPRPYLLAALAITAVWVVLDQTRWQPYLLNYVAGALCLLVGESASVRAPGPPAIRWHMAPFQLSLCATWAYSGAHKFNRVYVERVFPDLVGPVLGKLGVAQATAQRVLFWPGLASAALEAGLGLALLWPRTRRLAVLGLTGMHAFILLLMGPLGYSMNSVVWPWNVAVVAALWLLFWPRAAGDRLDACLRAAWQRLRRRGTDASPRPLRLAWAAVLLFFVLLPALNFAGLWPAALSFQMYAGKQRHAWIFYPADQRASMPPAAVRLARRPGQLDLIRWPLHELNVFPSLETGVLLRVGQSVARGAPQADVRLVIASSPALVTGRREFRTYVFRGPAFTPREVPTVRPLGSSPARGDSVPIPRRPSQGK